MPKTTRKTPLTGETEINQILTEQEELFCQYYVLNLNRIEAALKAYDIDRTKKYWRHTASSIAWENLLKPHINRRVRELIDKYHLNDEAVDSELSFIIQQNADLPTKKGAIDVYNRLKGRYEEDNKQKQPIIQVVKYEGDNKASV